MENVDEKLFIGNTSEKDEPKNSMFKEGTLLKNNLFYNKRDHIMQIGEDLLPFKHFKGIVFNHNYDKTLADVTIEFSCLYNTKNYTLSDKALRKLLYCFSEYNSGVKSGRIKLSNEKKEKELDKDWETFSNKNKPEFTLFGIKKEFIILYIILIFGFSGKIFGMEVSNEISQGQIIDGKFTEKEIRKEIPKVETPKSELHQVQEQKFNFTYIYDVNIDKCVSTDYYKYKFSYNDLKNPRLVVEFQDRPGELTLITPNGEMYVFTDTEKHCLDYRQKFLEDLRRQNTADENRFEDIK